MVPSAVAAAFGHSQGAILERDRDRAGVVVPSRPLGQRHEEPPVALDVVLLDVGSFQPEVHRYAVRGLPVVVVEVLGGLDVVLVAVGPVEIDLLAVVGDGVPLIAAVAALRDEVAVLVVAAEKGVEVVVDVGLDGLTATDSAAAWASR